MTQSANKPNYYQFFGLENFESDQVKIKAAYRSMMLKWHPDRNQDKENAHHMAQQVNEVYRVLSTCKISYDNHLRSKMGEPQRRTHEERTYKWAYSPFGAQAGDAVFDFDFSRMDEMVKKYTYGEYGAQQTPGARGRRKIKELPLTEQRIFIDCIQEWTLDEFTSAKQFVNRRRMRGVGR